MGTENEGDYVEYTKVLELKERNNRLVLNRLKGKKFKVDPVRNILQEKVPLTNEEEGLTTPGISNGVDRFDLQKFTSISIELSKFNGIGFFHKVHNLKHFNAMKSQWNRMKKVPAIWISKGYWPGIWTAMDSPHHTYTIIRNSYLYYPFLF